MFHKSDITVVLSPFISLYIKANTTGHDTSLVLKRPLKSVHKYKILPTDTGINYYCLFVGLTQADDDLLFANIIPK